MARSLVVANPHLDWREASLRSRRRGRGWVALPLVVTALAGLAVVAPQAAAVETIQITYGDLQAPPVTLIDLEDFASTGVPSRDLQMLLTILRIDEDTARHILTQEIPIDFGNLEEMANSFVGQFFWRLLATTVSVADESGETWELMRDAVLAAAASDRLSLLDILRHIDTAVLSIDSQRVLAMASNIRPEDIKILSSIFLGQ